MDNSAKQESESTVTPPKTENRLSGVLAPESALLGETLSEEALFEETPFEMLTLKLATSPPGYPSAQALQALETGDAEEALAICDSCGRFPDDSSLPLSLQLVRGRALLALDRADEATEEFHRLLRQEPECPAALKGLGDTYFAQKKEIIAFTYYERARELSGNSAALAEPVRYAPIEADSTPAEFVQPVTGLPDADISETVSSDATLTSAVSPDDVVNVVNATTIATLEEIVVRDSVADSQAEKVAAADVSDSDISAPSVSLTLKRGGEEATIETEAAPELVAEDKLGQPEVVSDTQAEPEAKEPTKQVEEDSVPACAPKEPLADVLTTHTTPTKLPERYDDVQRPEHYQTETMADVLLQQGHTAAAADIYRVLAGKNPLERLQEKLAKAESRQRRK